MIFGLMCGISRSLRAMKMTILSPTSRSLKVLNLIQFDTPLSRKPLALSLLLVLVFSLTIGAIAYKNQPAASEFLASPQEELANSGENGVAEAPVTIQQDTQGEETSDEQPTQKASAEEADVNEPRPSLSARTNRTEDAPKQASEPLSMEERFIASIAEEARLSQEATGVPASVTIAQAMLESDYGRSALARQANNYFGIKAKSKPGPAGVVNMNTWESINGKDIIVNEPFRAYHNRLESFIDHGMFFVENARYAAAMQNTFDPRKFAKLIHQAGYATDPKYSDKLIALMDKFNLYAYDLIK